MKTPFEIEVKNYKKEAKELIRLVFEKAHHESKAISKTALSKHIENELNSQINQRTLLRYYNQFILEMDEGINHNISGFDIVSRYLGYKGFADFCNQTFPVSTQFLKKEVISYPKKENRVDTSRLKWLLGATVFVFFGLGSFFSANVLSETKVKNQDVSRANHFSELSVSPQEFKFINGIDEKDLNSFQEVEVSDTIIYFKTDKSKVGYMRIKCTIGLVQDAQEQEKEKEKEEINTFRIFNIGKTSFPSLINKNLD